MAKTVNHQLSKTFPATTYPNLILDRHCLREDLGRGRLGEERAFGEEGNFREDDSLGRRSSQGAGEESEDCK